MRLAGPVPLREFCIKVASRCNLSCDYCYMYTGPDQSWRSQPRVMSTAVTDALAARIAEHVRTHGIGRVTVGLHGGEPLLAGAPAIERLITSVRAALPPPAVADFTVQTNATLLNERYLRLFARHDVRVGVSLDGSREANDRHRLRGDERSSFTDTTRALELLGGRRYRRLFGGILCVIDLANDPLDTLRSLAAFQPPAIDFLLPHANWSSPPPRPTPTDPAAYAGWLIPVFDEWYAGRGEPRIRLFDEALGLVLGGTSATETLGGIPAGFVIVETDGSVEAVDALKTSYDGAPATGTSVLTHSFDDALRHPVLAAMQAGTDGLCATCRSCPVMRVCGGGQYAHRYRAGYGFDQPSVYCADLRRLIEHIAARVERDLLPAGACPV